MSLNVYVITLLQLLNEQIHPLDIVIAAVEKLQADLTDNVDASVNLLEHSCISCTGLQVTIISILTLLLDYHITINSHTNVISYIHFMKEDVSINKNKQREQKITTKLPIVLLCSKVVIMS